MDINEQNILYNDVFTYLYQDQINEQNRITREITDITERDNLLKNIVEMNEERNEENEAFVDFFNEINKKTDYKWI